MRWYTRRIFANKTHTQYTTYTIRKWRGDRNKFRNGNKKKEEVPSQMLCVIKKDGMSQARSQPSNPLLYIVIYKNGQSQLLWLDIFFSRVLLRPSRIVCECAFIRLKHPFQLKWANWCSVILCVTHLCRLANITYTKQHISLYMLPLFWKPMMVLMMMTMMRKNTQTRHKKTTWNVIT